MKKKEEKKDEIEEITTWEVNEYEKHERTKTWYIIAITTALLLMLFSFATGNFLFSVIIIIVSLITILHEGNNPEKVIVELTDTGIIVGRKFYDYDELKDFSILYKPHQNIKNLYFEFNNVLKQRLSIPLNNVNPLPIRKFLLRYLSEDLERTTPPLSEGLAKLFKL